MASDFDFLNPNDKPALLAVSQDSILQPCQHALEQMGYKVHTVAGHDQFLNQFSQVQYQVVIIEQTFHATVPSENVSLSSLQTMPVQQRRHAVLLLIGNGFKSLDAMQAFQQSVHAVVNPADIQSIQQIIQKTLADNDLFLSIYRDTQLRIAQGSI